MTIGNSGGLSEGKQPKNVGLWFTPVEINSSGVEGMGGKAWCDSCNRLVIRCWLNTTDEPLAQMSDASWELIDCSYFGHLFCASSALASTATMTSRPRALTNCCPSGIFSRFDEPSMSCSQVAFESSNVSGLIDWKGCEALTKANLRSRRAHIRPICNVVSDCPYVCELPIEHIQYGLAVT